MASPRPLLQSSRAYFCGVVLVSGVEFGVDVVVVELVSVVVVDDFLW